MEPNDERRTDSPLLRFMIHLDSQDDCDDSTQLDSYFLGAQKRLDSRFQIILALRSTIQLMILSELWQTGADSTQFNSFMSFNAKCCKYTPLHICLNSSPPKLSKSVAKQSVIWCCWHFWELHWFSMRWIKVNLLPVSLSSLHQIGRAHVWTPVTDQSRMPSSAWKKKKKTYSFFFFYPHRKPQSTY